MLNSKKLVNQDFFLLDSHKSLNCRFNEKNFSKTVVKVISK